MHLEFRIASSDRSSSSNMITLLSSSYLHVRYPFNITYNKKTSTIAKKLNSRTSSKNLGMRLVCVRPD
jgi:hypothetical protein